ncbi:MAG: double-strand break repair helicase AddA [Proteobacteria bacterium]|nr:double-strand break repair helicase AddA [Pseudomonadota bacterium]
MRDARKISPGPSAQATPETLKARATDPAQSVWVGASAGSGKTTVLTERVLRLLLPEGDRKGADPAKIICITFTKAAASEVLERVMKYLRAWAIEPSEKLDESLEKILGTPPKPNQREAARALFARILDVPGGMKILTIHAFCQSVLGRFPMEAGLPAGFEVMEEQEAKSLMTDVRHNLITSLQAGEHDAALRRAFDYLSSYKNVDDLEKLLASIASERARLETLLARYGGIDALCRALYQYLDTHENETLEAQIDRFLDSLPEADLRSALPLLEADTSKKNNAHFRVLAPFLAADRNARRAQIEPYKRIFLTQKGTGRDTYSIVIKNDALAKLFANETARSIALDTAQRNLTTATATSSLLRFAERVLVDYEARKRQKNRLDFEDLIHKTKQLLGEGGVHWVQYKLDGGIDHILVDEAQDTNPDQWDIINALSDEFYDGTSVREKQDRTTFVVGDEKQSIFSFQRADPRVFDAIKTRLAKKVRDAQLKFDDVPIQTSFRSAPSILKVVDGVFESPEMLAGVSRSTAVMKHEAYLSGKAGHVEIWPAIKRQKEQEKSSWHPLDPQTLEDNPVTLLANKVAATIRMLLDDPAQKINSQDRRIEAGDIMILLAKRKPFADALLKALRRQNIPVSGIDRMVVTKQLSVMDTMACIAFILQPEDDLALATLLKSPFIGWDDDALFNICHNRTDTLWKTLQDNPEHELVATWLAALLQHAGRASVSAFLHFVLFSPCPKDSRSGMRALMARLGTDITDPLQELLRRADTYDLKDTRGLQGFFDDAQKDESEIKRQIHEGGGCVRLMTVHGSKGLEAPIVFLPDTIRTSQSAGKTDPILWPDRNDMNDIPLWAPSSDRRADAMLARATEAKERADEEYRRLLYVALTRAGERLYIGGADYVKAGADRTKSWYDRTMAAFKDGRIKHIETLEDGTMIVKNRQTDATKNSDRSKSQGTEVKSLPAWATTRAPAPEFPPRPLTPSKPDGDEPAALSPLFGDTSWRFARGRIIHTLFQFLPALPAQSRRAKATNWLAEPAHDLSPEVQSEILSSVMNVLENPAFSELFDENARAEVPLTGLIGHNRIVSGQIDRLVITPQKIMVLDYKTNRPAPKLLADVPEAYKRQMQTYRDILKKIWPEKPVHCALLWTDGPNLMDITEILEP